MSSRWRSKSLKILIAINCALFFCAVTVASVASLIASNISSQNPKADGFITNQVSLSAQISLDKKYSRLLQAAKNEIEEKEETLQQIRKELDAGYVISKDIDVSDSKRAYWLAEPKLMLGVNTLAGGTLQVNFADQSKMISVGERIDFKVEDCDCFLLLKSSQYGNASFRFSCKLTSGEDGKYSHNSIVEARIN
jgi:hypothetical protein